MTREHKRPYCTNAEWRGRVDCKTCKIRDLMLFSGLPEEAFDNNLMHIDNIVFGSEGILYEAGRNDGVIYTVRRGLVKLLHLAPNGVHRIVRLLGPGSAIGIELLDGGNVYRHTAVAVNEADVCRIPLATMARLQAEFPELCKQIRHRLQQQLDRADQWIISLGTGPAKERVANLLLMLTEFTANPNGDIELLGREDMAAIVGTSVETVSRIIAELKRRRLVYKVASHLYRCDTGGLQSIAEQSVD